VSGRPRPARNGPDTIAWMSGGLDGEGLPVGFRVVGAVTPFERRVERMVRRIPAGTVASYGRVAEWVGVPDGARAVGGVMARSGDGVPWHRVVTAAGRLVPGHEVSHAELLRSEGVRVANGHVPSPIPWWAGPRRRR
jgi:methylated-DNA-protein-cysteine methyltransferase-like protein